MKYPLVSIVCPVYNCQAYLPETIQSVLEQTYTEWELLIVNDGSTDKTGAIADDFASRDARIHVFHQQNSGLPAVPRNRAIEKARGLYAAFLDGDDSWKPDKLRLQVEFLERNMDFDAVYTGYELIGEPSTVEFFSKIWMWNNHQIATFQIIFMSCLIRISSLMIRRQLLDILQGFDENPRLKGVEDYDFLLRLASLKPVFHIKEPLCQYRLVKGSISHTPGYGRFEKEMLIIDKLERMGLVADQSLIRRKKSEILYNRAIDSLYVYNQAYRKDFLSAFLKDPFNLKKIITFFSSWMPKPLLKLWLVFLLSIKNKFTSFC